jgi:phage N-6-adenine-methyltransferase
MAFSSNSDSWYTPAPIIEAARKVLGCIDLDPASAAEPQKWIKAEKFYTIEEDSLKKVWTGKVWLNPPFNQSAKFVNKLTSCYKAGYIKEGILLVKCVPAYNWFQPLKKYPMIVTDKRVSFWRAENQPGTSKMDTAISLVYFPAYPEKINFFHEVFSQFGDIVTFSKFGI